MTPLARVVTVSDSVVEGTRIDRSGPALAERLRQMGFSVESSLVADGVDSVAGALRAASDGFAGLIVTTGGTGFGPRDLTPEATAQVIERNAPGLAEAARASSDLGPLSRGMAGVRGTALIVNLPGSPAAVLECVDAIGHLLPHALALLTGADTGHPHSEHSEHSEHSDAATPPATGALVHTDLTHVDERGQARMVDISGKEPTRRVARAACRVVFRSDFVACLAEDTDEAEVLGEARIAGIQASKSTALLIPLCHPIALSAITIEISANGNEVSIAAVAETVERTGVEMEALTACTVSALAIVGACRADDEHPTIEDLTLWEKSGGRSGHWSRPPPAGAG